MCFESFQESFPVLTLCDLWRLGWLEGGSGREVAFPEEMYARDAISLLPTAVCVLFRVQTSCSQDRGERSLNLADGTGTRYMSKGESISARRRGGKFLMKTVWLKEQGKDRNHTRNVGNSQRWERRWIKCMKRTLGDRQATNFWFCKTKW